VLGIERVLRIQHALDLRGIDLHDVQAVVLIHGNRQAPAERKLDALQGRRAAIVPGIAHQDDAVVGQRVQHERPAAIGLAPPRLALRFYLLSIDHQRRRIGEFGQEISLGSIDPNLQRVVINNAKALDMFRLSLGKLAHPDDIIEIDRGDGRSQRRAAGAFQGIDDVLCGDRPAALENRIGPQGKRVRPPIGADIPPFGQVGRHFQIRIQRNQTAEQMDGILGRCAILDQSRIQSRGRIASQAQRSTLTQPRLSLRFRLQRRIGAGRGLARRHGPIAQVSCNAAERHSHTGQQDHYNKDGPALTRHQVVTFLNPSYGDPGRRAGHPPGS